jgi:pyruvoyl-dependent arginine decarboxylase (PvlArgDC)
MSDKEIKDLWLDIVLGKGNHGSFLVSFGETLLKADAENFQLLKPIALILMEKYSLE